MCLLLSNIISSQNLIKQESSNIDLRAPEPIEPTTCSNISPASNYVDNCFEENFNTFINHDYYNTYLGKNRTSCSCITNIVPTTINTSLNNFGADVNLVSNEDPLINHLTQSDSNETNPWGNPTDLTLNSNNGGGRGLRINTVPSLNNIWSEDEFSKAPIYTIDFKSEGITEISFDFATVFEYWDNPLEHNHPYFKASIINPKNNDIIATECINPESTTFNGGSPITFETLNKPPPYNTPNPDLTFIDKVRFSNWNTMTLQIPQANRNTKLQLQIEVGDCNGDNWTFGQASQHAGYAYIDNIITSCINIPPPTTCPEASCLDIVQVANCVDYQAWMNCNDPNIDYIDWYYTISGSFVHQFAGRSGGNPAGQHAMPIYLPRANTPSGTWDNYNLYVYANIVFNDGTVCDEIYTVITLSCTGGGGGGGPMFGANPNSLNPDKELIDNIKISLSRNPVKPFQELEFKGINYKDVIGIEVLDIFGNPKITMKPTKNSLNVGRLSSGLYYVRFTTKYGTQQKKLIIK